MSGKMLKRVRALLNKAESTEFGPEGESLREAAERLMATYGIEQAMLAASGEVDDELTTMIINFDDPFSTEKCCLLGGIATALRCRAIGHRPADKYGYTVRGSKTRTDATVVGHASDLEQVELLYTSLLLQASGQVAKISSGMNGRRGAARTRLLRASFLLGFANRVSERLTEIHRQATQEVDMGSLLPVLADRRSKVDAMVNELFSKITTGRGRTIAPQAYKGGVQAANAADVNQSRFNAGRQQALPQGG